MKLYLATLIILLFSFNLEAIEKSNIMISAPGLDPYKITKILAIEPSKAGADVRTETKDQSIKNGAFVSFWRLQAPDDLSSIWKHKTHWIKFIGKYKNELKKISGLATPAGELKITIFFTVEFFSLEPDDMKFFAKHNIHISVHESNQKN